MRAAPIWCACTSRTCASGLKMIHATPDSSRPSLGMATLSRSKRTNASNKGFMESADLFTLTEEHWKAIEKISDLLAEPADLPVALTLQPDAAALNTQATASANDLAQALQQSLELLLNTLGRVSGAFFLPRFCEHIAQDWTLISPPEEWETQDLSGRSLLEALAEQAMLTGQVQPGNEDLQIGAVFPIRSTRKALGALLVCG